MLLGFNYSLPCSLSWEPTPHLGCHGQLHIIHSRVFVEQKVMAPICAELLQYMDPVYSEEVTDMERGFEDQVSWSITGPIHLTTPGSTVEASKGDV